MKTISILIPTINAGGAEKQAVLLAVQLSKRTDVNLIVLYGDQPEYKRNRNLLSQSQVKVYRLTGNILSKMTCITRILRNTRTEVLLNYLTLPDIIGSIVGKSLGIKVYNGIRNSVLPRYKMIAERFAHNCLAQGTIYNSYSGEESFRNKGFRGDKNIVIPNCFPDISETISREEHSTKIIITVGRFDKAKDYETLIKSISLLKRNDFRLHIVGYGELESQIHGWVEMYGIENKADIFINPDNVPELEREADIYLSTSIFEGTSNSIMEALNLSLPVVATRVGDNDRLVDDGQNGYLQEPGDCEGIAVSLNRLLNSCDLRNEMGKRGNQLLRENYSVEIFEKRYIELIGE